MESENKNKNKNKRKLYDSMNKMKCPIKDCNGGILGKEIAITVPTIGMIAPFICKECKKGRLYKKWGICNYCDKEVGISISKIDEGFTFSCSCGFTIVSLEINDSIMIAIDQIVSKCKPSKPT